VLVYTFVGCYVMVKVKKYDSNASIRMAAQGKGPRVVPNASKNRASLRMAARGKGDLDDML